MARLTSLSDSGSETAFELTDERLTIGRSSDNNIALRDSAISRHHAELFLRDNLWMARDLGSRNGLLINGKKVKERALFDGDILTVGESVLRFDETANGGDRLGWQTISDLTLVWPVADGPAPQDSGVGGRSLIHRPIHDHPLLPDETSLRDRRREEIIQQALLLQEIHASLLAAPDAATLWSDILHIVMRFTMSSWAGAFVPPARDGALPLLIEGKCAKRTEIPMSLVTAAIRSRELVHWSSTEHADPPSEKRAKENTGTRSAKKRATKSKSAKNSGGANSGGEKSGGATSGEDHKPSGAKSHPLEAFVVVPWISEDGMGGALFAPGQYGPPADLDLPFDLLAGLALELSHWYPTASKRWTGPARRASSASRRASSRTSHRPHLTPPAL
jgi:hypothetical protein